MGTILSRYIVGIAGIIIAATILSSYSYHKGYQAAENRCQKEKLELIIKKDREKAEIIDKIRKKTPVERRKALSRYVIV